VNVSEFFGKNKIFNNGGSAKMEKKGIVLKAAGIGAGVLAVAGIAIAVAISGGDDLIRKIFLK
ncbi:MAG: hypothetical protein IJA27_04230, partial [Lachnospiraceae bacterium]|nr:hypothetical protein [Lachnospiraceae bacterium]